MGWKLDWRKFRQFLKDEYGVEKAFTFIGYMPENESLYEYMHSLGYLVVLKPTLEINGPPKDANGDPKPGGRDPKDKSLIKGNVDTEIVLTAMKELSNYSKAIIVSADGDFYSLIEYLVSKQRLAKIITPNWQYSTLLKEFEPYIVNLDQYKSRLTYIDNRRKKRNPPSNARES